MNEETPYRGERGGRFDADPLRVQEMSELVKITDAGVKPEDIDLYWLEVHLLKALVTYHIYKTGQNKSFSSKRKRLAESLIAHANGILSDREEVNGFLRADGAPPGFFETLERLIAEAQPTVDYSDILAKNFDKQYRPLRQVVGELVEVFE